MADLILSDGVVGFGPPLQARYCSTNDTPLAAHVYSAQVRITYLISHFALSTFLLCSSYGVKSIYYCRVSVAGYLQCPGHRFHIEKEASLRSPSRTSRASKSSAAERAAKSRITVAGQPTMAASLRSTSVSDIMLLTAISVAWHHSPFPR